MTNKKNILEQHRGQETFANRMKMLTTQFGGASTIAKTCGFSEGVVRSWRDGRSDPSRARCLALAKGLGVSLMWLVSGEGGIQPESTDSMQHAPTATIAQIQQQPGAMDPSRLTAAAEILESTLQLVGADSSMARNSDLLAGYYELLGYIDPVKRARTVAMLNRRVLERARADEKNA